MTTDKPADTAENIFVKIFSHEGLKTRSQKVKAVAAVLAFDENESQQENRQRLDALRGFIDRYLEPQRGQSEGDIEKSKTLAGLYGMLIEAIGIVHDKARTDSARILTECDYKMDEETQAKQRTLWQHLTDLSRYGSALTRVEVQLGYRIDSLSDEATASQRRGASARSPQP